MILNGIKVLEFEGLAPVPFSGMILSDFGADVIRLDKPKSQFGFSKDYCARGKRSISIDLKNYQARNLVVKIIRNMDVLLDPYRPGVMESLGLGPSVALKANPRLIYARLSGYGQTGPLSDKGGHDINYLAMSGLLSMIGRKTDKPLAPLNLIGDFAGGSLMCTLGIVLALLEREKTGKGQVIDSSIVDGVAYLSTFVFNATKGQIFSKPRGYNILDSGAPFYEVYETKDHAYMAVGSIEQNFFTNLLKGLSIDPNVFYSQFDESKWDNMRDVFRSKFLEKTQEEWTEIFSRLDACVTPVLTIDQFKEHDNTKSRNIWNIDSDSPNPSPLFSTSTANLNTSLPSPQDGQHTVEILIENGLKLNEIEFLIDSKVVKVLQQSKL